MRRVPSVTGAASCACPAHIRKRSLICSPSFAMCCVAEAEAEADTSSVLLNHRNMYSNAFSPSEAWPSDCAANGCSGGFCA